MRVKHSDLSAEELLVNVTGGCHDSFRELHDRFSKTLIGIASGITRDSSEAKDVVQDSFISVWKNPGQYDPRYGKVSTWLFRITRNRALDHLRKSKRSEATAHKASMEPGSETALTTSADAAPSAAEMESQVAAVLRKLPQKQRDSLVLSYYEGMSQTEIADRLGEPLGTVKSRITRAIKCARSLIAVPFL